MKSKGFQLRVVGLYIFAVGGFLLLQGCASGRTGVGTLYWPYDEPMDEPGRMPEIDYPVDSMEQVDSVELPPDMYSTPSYQETVETPSKIYIVRKGDTLSGIAKIYGTSWKKLVSFNNLPNPNKLSVGQSIQIPGDLSQVLSSVPSSSSKSVSTAPKSGKKRSKKSIPQGKSYVIQKGDTLSGFATRSGVSIPEIKAANALNGNQIVAGKSLSIPKKGAVVINITSEPTPTAKSDSKSVTVKVDVPKLAPIVEAAAPVETAAADPVYEHILYPGETIQDVARQYSVSQDDILWLNGITDPSTLKSGMKILVPVPE